MSDDLRDRLAAALRPAMLLGLQDAELYDEPGRERINEWVDWIGDTLAPLVQAELDREVEVSQRLMRQRQQMAEERFAWQERGDRAEAALARVRELHQPARGGRSGWNPDDDDTPGAYGHIESACEECGSQDMAVRWPCPTVQAIDAALAGPAGAGSAQDGA